MFKGAIAGLLLGTSALLAQEKPLTENITFFHPDSTITTELEEVIVKADKDKIELPEAKESGFQTIYFSDANKIAMSQYSGIFSVSCGFGGSQS